MLPRASVRWVEAQGDYARLHTADASHLVRVSLATLAEQPLGRPLLWLLAVGLVALAAWQAAEVLRWRGTAS